MKNCHFSFLAKHFLCLMQRGARPARPLTHFSDEKSTLFFVLIVLVLGPSWPFLGHEDPHDEEHRVVDHEHLSF